MGRQHFQPNTIQHLWFLFECLFDVYICIFVQCWNVHLEIQEIQRLLSHFVSAQISLARPIAHCCLLNSPSPTL